LAVLAASYEVGCRKVHFFGGEPTLNKNLAQLIAAARGMGYELIEVYTNLVHLTDDLLVCFATNDVCVATSAYSKSRRTHDLITKTPGSFDRTMANLRKVVSRGLKVRVSIIEMEENAGDATAAARFLKEQMGIQEIKIDRARPFGRAGDNIGGLGDLCGSCAGGTLCISPDGEVSPCIMSKKWPVGSVRRQPLMELLRSDRLANIRREIRDATSVNHRTAWHSDRLSDTTDCEPQVCGPDVGCPPLNECGPKINGANFVRR
jgi:MoaA/NifB/PqqE/SkfB family radical SAM enzyme